MTLHKLHTERSHSVRAYIYLKAAAAAATGGGASAALSPNTCLYSAKYTHVFIQNTLRECSFHITSQEWRVNCVRERESERANGIAFGFSFIKDILFTIITFLAKYTHTQKVGCQNIGWHHNPLLLYETRYVYMNRLGRHFGGLFKISTFEPRGRRRQELMISVNFTELSCTMYTLPFGTNCVSVFCFVFEGRGPLKLSMCARFQNYSS